MTWAAIGKACRSLRTGSGRARVAVILLIVAALGNVRLLRSVTQYYLVPLSDAENVPAYMERYARLKAELPCDGVVGYVDDGRRSSYEFALASMLTRYVMAPVRVLEGAVCPLVIANLKDPAGQPDGRGVTGLVLVRDFGNGVRLYRNPAKE